MLKHSVNIKGHATSISLEREFWEVLEKIAQDRAISCNALITEIDEHKTTKNLSSAIRVYILNHLLPKSSIT